MSEDYHDSNNLNPFTGEPQWFPTHLPNPAWGTESVPCHECGEPVLPEEAYLFEFSKRDGTTDIAVFHKGIDRMCPLKWAAERLESISGRLEAILALFKYVDDGRD
jgi:hypothetical protein